MSAEPEPITPLFGASFGALLRRYREAAELTQEQLAERASLSVRGVSDLERGLRQAPRRDTVALLADALSLSPQQRALLTAAARPAAHRRPARMAASTPSNLPAQLTPLLGREQEIQQAMALLTRPEARLLTLTGPGGVGKTRLALAVAEDLCEVFTDGVYLAPLAALRDPALVLASVAEALGLRIAPTQPLAGQVHSLLRNRRMLLVFDNFEHLLDATPQLVALLEACPQLKALVTSREPLKLAGEQAFPVAPLALDAATRLFIERAQAAQPTFTPIEADEPVIATICERVDRLPLAIELAASWTPVLTPAALLDRLSSRLELLSSGRRAAPARQRALRETIAWSADLLRPEEQRLFRQLSVFVGGCTLTAAEAVCADPADDLNGAGSANATLVGLARLVEKSLLRVAAPPDAASEATRFTMLETIREYAHELLVASGEAQALERRHAEHITQVIVQLGWIGDDQDARDQRLERELPNARAALAWAQRAGEPGIGLKLATPIGRWWYSRGAFDEAERWLRTLLALDAQAEPPTAAPSPLRVAALYALTLIALDRRQYVEAEALAQEGLALARRHGDAARAGNMLAELGHVAEARGDLDAARAYFEEGLAQYQRGDEGAAIGRTLSSLGNLARARGDYAQARAYLEQALAWARERDFGFAIASGLVSLGHVACEQGESARGAELYHEGLTYYRTLRNPASLAWCLVGVAVTRAAADDVVAVAQLCGAIAALRASAGAVETAEWPPFAQARAAAQSALGAEGFAEVYASGHALSAEDAIAYALDLTRPAESR